MCSGLGCRASRVTSHRAFERHDLDQNRQTRGRRCVLFPCVSRQNHWRDGLKLPAPLNCVGGDRGNRQDRNANPGFHGAQHTDETVPGEGQILAQSCSLDLFDHLVPLEPARRKSDERYRFRPLLQLVGALDRGQRLGKACARVGLRTGFLDDNHVKFPFAKLPRQIPAERVHCSGVAHLVSTLDDCRRAPPRAPAIFEVEANPPCVSLVGSANASRSSTSFFSWCCCRA